MLVTDQQVATLRARLSGDMGDFRRLVAPMDSPEKKKGFDALVTTAFFEAVQRRFAVEGTVAGDAEVAEFVAAVRRRTEDAAEIVPPRVGELLINLALGKAPVPTKNDPEDDVSFMAKVFLLQVLVGDEGFSDAELDDFLARARETAEETFA